MYKQRISVNTLRPRQYGRFFADNVLKCIFLNENVWISLKIPLKFISKGPINNIPALVHIMAWRRPGDKPISEPMLVFVLTHICVTGPQWVNHFHIIERIYWYGCIVFHSLYYIFLCRRRSYYILKALSQYFIPIVSQDLVCVVRPGVLGYYYKFYEND